MIELIELRSGFGELPAINRDRWNIANCVKFEVEIGNFSSFNKLRYKF
jgi:hypothetical protein